MLKESKKKYFFNKKSILLGKFIFKYLSIFFLYGYLFLSGTMIFGFLFYKFFYTTQGFIRYFQFLWLFPGGYCFVRFLIILSTTNYKWRYYRISHYRLYTRGYSENYFKYEIYEPCTRLIVKDVLLEFDFKDEYKLLKNKYLHVNQRIEDEKDRLLTQVMRSNEIKKTEEVLYGKNIQS